MKIAGAKPLQFSNNMKLMVAGCVSAGAQSCNFAKYVSAGAQSSNFGRRVSACAQSSKFARFKASILYKSTYDHSISTKS